MTATRSPFNVVLVSLASLFAAQSGCVTALGDVESDETDVHHLGIGSAGFATTQRVLVLDLDPVLENRGGRRVSQVYGYHDPRVLADELVHAMPEVSHGSVRFEIAAFRDLDAHHVRQDGFRFDDDSYARCLENRADCGGRVEEPDADYRDLIDRHDLCTAVERDGIDEVWVFAGPYAGFYESAMAGQGSYWINGTARDERCGKRFVIMWFNYERTLAEMLHNYGHRIESTMTHVLRNRGTDGPFARFTRHATSHPGQPSCGNVHFPPNGRFDYDYTNPARVTSTCEGDATYPSRGGSSSIGCDAWGCSHLGYMRYWLGHLPHASGASNGIASNWWAYAFGLESHHDRCTAHLDDRATCVATGCEYASTGMCMPPGFAAPGAAPAGDVDGDGRADLVVLDGRTGGVTVHPGGPHATFGVAAPSTALGLDSALLDGRGADVFGVADVDGDGHGDLLAAADDGHAYVYRGREDGTFASPVASFAGTFDVSRRGSAGHEVLGLGDVDGDGRADLVTFYTRDGSVYVYSADGAGVFSRQRSSFRGTFQSRYAGGAGHYAVGVADVDGDGRADLTTVHSDGNAYVYPGQRDGSFGGYVASFDGSFTLSSMAARFHEPIGLGDVNGDGRADLTSAYRDGCVYTYPGGADGRFGYGVRTCRPETDAASIELVDTMDVDADGFADLVTIAAGGVVSVLRGQPSGGFDASRSGAVSISTVRFGGSDEALSEDRTVRRRGAIFDVP